MWGWLVGGSAAKKKDAPKKAILDLRQQLEMLQKREKFVEGQIAEQDAIARKNIQSNKNAARTALKRKKMHEHNLTTTQAQIETLEQQMHSIETSNLNWETLKVMKGASDAMKVIHNGMNMDQIDATIDDIQTQATLATEISNAITSVPLGEQVDEDDIARELEAMEQEALDNVMLKAPPAPVTATPNANVALKGKAPAQEEDDEEAELRKLQAEMAMS
ncbi:ESCRT-III subunit protein snf7 [Rhizina undulata]